MVIWAVVRLTSLLFIILLVVSCGSKRIDNTQTVSTPLLITVIGAGIYTESEKIDALKTIDSYWFQARDCAIMAVPAKEEYVLSINPRLITVKVRAPSISEKTGQEYFNCFADKCSALIEGRRIDTVPSLPALGHEFGHYWNRLLFGGTNHSEDDLSMVCNTPRICHEYVVNEHLLNCK